MLQGLCGSLPIRAVLCRFSPKINSNIYPTQRPGISPLCRPATWHVAHREHTSVRVPGGPVSSAGPADSSRKKPTDPQAPGSLARRVVPRAWTFRGFHDDDLGVGRCAVGVVMAYVERCGKVWRGHWLLADGHRHGGRSGFATKWEAKHFADACEVAERAAAAAPVTERAVTVAAWWDRWFPAQDLAPATLETYAQQYRHCRLLGNGLSTVAAVRRGSWWAMGMGSCFPGMSSGLSPPSRSGRTRPRPPRSATARWRRSGGGATVPSSSRDVP
jgi:hypothetical protein